MGFPAAEITRYEAEIDAGMAQIGEGGDASAVTAAIKGVGTALVTDQEALKMGNREVRDAYERLVNLSRMLGANAREADGVTAAAAAVPQNDPPQMQAAPKASTKAVADKRADKKSDTK